MKVVKTIIASLLIALIALPMTTIDAQDKKKNKKKHKKYAKVEGDGNIVTKDRSVANFTAISVQNGSDLYITQGSPNKVTVKADANLQDHIKTEVKDGTLKIYAKKRLGKAKKREVHVTVSNLKALAASGGSDVFAKKGLKTGNFALSMSGGSDLDLVLTADELKCSLSGGSDANISGSVGHLKVSASGGSDLNGKNLSATDCDINVSGGSDVDISGKAKSLDVVASGGSDINAGGFQVNKCKLVVSGGADATVKVKDELSMTASGASDIDYYGNPKITHKKVSKNCDVTHHK